MLAKNNSSYLQHVVAKIATKRVVHIAKNHFHAQVINRGGKRCEWCERCSCKEFPSGVKSLVKQDIKGGVRMSNVFDNSWKQTRKTMFSKMH